MTGAGQQGAGPLGPRVPKPEPPAGPEWRAVPDKPHLEVNAQGQMRTRLPVPPLHPHYPFRIPGGVFVVLGGP